jgi:hypothetical protein
VLEDLRTLKLGIKAFGTVEEINGEMSFAVMSVEFSPAIGSSLVTLHAVGGVFGLNRTVDGGPTSDSQGDRCLPFAT